MIKLTLCRKRADKDGGRRRVKGLNCLPRTTRRRCRARILLPKYNDRGPTLFLIFRDTCDVVVNTCWHTQKLKNRSVTFKKIGQFRWKPLDWIGISYDGNNLIKTACIFL